MSDLIDTTEMYLRTIYELAEEGIVPLRARIAERLGHSGPTVSQTVSRMERDGLLIIGGDRHLELTKSGSDKAMRVMRKHRLAERLLTDVIGLDWEFVHEEACRWEHVMSDEVERRLVEVLDDVTRSPFGNPIPGLSDLGFSQDLELDSGFRAIDLPYGQTVTARIVQLNEILQVDQEQFQILTAAGIRVGTIVEITNEQGRVVISYNGQTVELMDDLAHAVRVEKVEV